MSDNPTTYERVKKLDAGLRHKAGATSEDFVQHYCKVLRGHAYATSDDSWNELEKTLTHVLGMLIYHKRRSEILGLPTDPRRFVREVEEAQRVLQKAMDSAYTED